MIDQSDYSIAICDLEQDFIWLYLARVYINKRVVNSAGATNWKISPVTGMSVQFAIVHSRNLFLFPSKNPISFPLELQKSDNICQPSQLTSWSRDHSFHVLLVSQSVNLLNHIYSVSFTENSLDLDIFPVFCLP